MTRHAREAVALAAAAAVGESTLQALVTTDWSAVGGLALLFAFLIGPQLFLAVLTCRRGEHPVRSRVLFAVTAVLAVGGLGVLGYNLYRFNTDAAFRRTPNMSGLIVPLVQWAIIGVVWLWLVIREAQEKRAARRAEKSGVPVGSGGATKPPQSA